MKTREVVFLFDVDLKLIDAYGNVRKTISLKANTPKSIPVPFKREFYEDSTGQKLYIYEGNGVLKDFSINVEFFEINDELVNSFDKFLLSNECKKNYKPLFESIYKVLDINTSQHQYIKCPHVQELEMAIINKARLEYA